MRKFLSGGLLAASLGGAAVGCGVLGGGAVLTSANGPTTQCDTPVGPNVGAGQVSVLSPSGLATNGELQVCSSNSPIIDGTATAEGSAGANGINGYAVANGDPGSNATGYIGAEGGTSGTANVVGCSSGDYNNGTNSNTDGTNGTSAPGPNDGTGTTDSNGNNVIVGTSGNSLADTASGPCSVTNEPAP